MQLEKESRKFQVKFGRENFLCIRATDILQLTNLTTNQEALTHDSACALLSQQLDTIKMLCITAFLLYRVACDNFSLNG